MTHDKEQSSAKPCINNANAMTEEEISTKLDALRNDIKNKRYKEAVAGYRTLAHNGVTEAEKEYANLLEKGQLMPKNLDLAMKYFYRAALKNDAYSAYRYSRLASGTSRDVSRFWLLYSAVLGCSAAYPDTAEEFSREGYDEDALYFTRLAADCNDTDSIVSLAKRYFKGIGTEAAPEYAKWYMDKLKIPPIYAIKLAYKLRGVTAKEPPQLTLKGYDGLLRKLAAKAKECSLDNAYHRLVEMLAARGDTASNVELAVLLLEGRGCKQNITTALKLLTKSAAMGNLRANLVLGDLHFDEKLFPKDTPVAISYYKRAGDLGAYQAYEIIGDIYYTGAGISKNVIRAIEFYDMAADRGSKTARERSDKIKKERETLFQKALAAQYTNEQDAFKLYSLSASLGHTKAKLKLAECFEHGTGTKINRRNAFILNSEAAAETENAKALTALGRCYALGIGTNRNYKLARAALKKAEKLGDESASALIAMLMQRKIRKVAASHLSTAIRLIYQGKAEIAAKHLEAAAYLENPKAIYTLGCLYEFGIGVDCDKPKGYDLYERAFSLFFRDPRSVYKLSILRLVKSSRR